MAAETYESGTTPLLSGGQHVFAVSAHWETAVQHSLPAVGVLCSGVSCEHLGCEQQVTHNRSPTHTQTGRLADNTCADVVHCLLFSISGYGKSKRSCVHTCVHVSAFVNTFTLPQQPRTLMRARMHPGLRATSLPAPPAQTELTRWLRCVRSWRRGLPCWGQQPWKTSCRYACVWRTCVCTCFDTESTS